MFLFSFSRILYILSLLILISADPIYADSEYTKPILFYVYKNMKKDGKEEIISIPKGLLSMSIANTAPMANCAQYAEKVKIESVQFSKSGVTLKSFIFTTKNNQISMPTHIESLSKIDRGEANNLIRPGRIFFVRYQLCGSGGYPSLIDLIDWDYLVGQY